MGAKTCQPQQQTMKQAQTPKGTKLSERWQSAGTGNAMKMVVVLKIVSKLGEDLLPTDAPPLVF